ncbi:hypothetical protein NL676_025379 [Syzygium grande]|nr:hypothetical protein NL676_025379 [Syzygium grande]
MAIRHPRFCFQPTNEHLSFHYLLQRLNQEPLPDLNVIRDCDVYGGGAPWKIFGKDINEKFYFFTMLKKKNKSRVDRTTGSGTWKGKQSHKIRDSQGKPVGYKKLFTFNPKASLSAKADKAENGHRIMAVGHLRKRIDEQRRRHAHSAMITQNAVNNPSPALPPSTAAAAQARPAASPAFREDAVPNPSPTVTPIVTWTIPQNICGNANYVNSLPTTMTAVQHDTCGVGSLAFGSAACLNPSMVAAVQDDIFYTADSQAFHSNGNTNPLPPAAANMQGDTCNAACRAFGGPIADLLPTTSMAAQGVHCKWAHQLMNTEMDPSVQYHSPYSRRATRSSSSCKERSR